MCIVHVQISISSASVVTVDASVRFLHSVVRPQLYLKLVKEFQYSSSVTVQEYPTLVKLRRFLASVRRHMNLQCIG